MKTQEEILARIAKVKPDDFFGFETYVLIDALEYENAKPFLKEGTPRESWCFTQVDDADGGSLVHPYATDEHCRKNAISYLRFAWSKADGHRGLSANRSVAKLTSYCWLLGYDVKAIEDAPYPSYGCPKLKVVAELLGQPLPTDPALVNMMEGRPCEANCNQGCSS